MTHPDSRRTAFLQEMGVGPVWRLRQAGAVQALQQAGVQPPQAEVPAPIAPVSHDDLPSWVTEEAPFDHEVAALAQPASPPAIDIANMDWDALQAAVADCTKCRLCEGRTRTVFGTGDRQARWLFVGEGPGHNEDLQGEPFIGPAGKLLDNMMGAMGLKRGENTYIANIVKCRPIGENGRDRQPAPDESATCLP